MKLDDNKLDLIYKYLHDTLSPEESDAFNALKTDKDFTDALLRESLIKKALDKDREEKVTSFIEAIEKKHELKQKKNIRGNKNKLWTLILALVIISSLMIFLVPKLIQGNNSTNEVLFAEYYTAYPVEVITRGTVDELSESYKSALKSYSTKDYQSAFNKFQEIDGNYDKINLYKAICLIETKKYDEAMSFLKRNQSSENVDIKNESEWYLSLSYLKGGDLDNAKSILDKISLSANHPYKADALKLLNDLSK